MKSILVRSLVAIFCGALAHASWALDDKDGTSVTCSNTNNYGNPYFGDTHVHTTLSVDAYTQGVDTTPDQAYRFAKGEEIGLHPFDENGVPSRFVQLERPLDFAVVADHAEFFGETTLCLDENNPIYNDPQCELLRERSPAAFLGWNVLLGALQNNVQRFDFCGVDGAICTAEVPSIWQEMQDAAELHYDRTTDCEFTTFIGYEWTGAPTEYDGMGSLETKNLHRNIIFRNSIVPDAPASYLDAPYPENLWDSLDADCRDVVDGANECDVLTIPHNSNLSQGMIFEAIKPTGVPYGWYHALRRATFEPLVEIIQHKGQSECLPSANDELCGFEVIPWGHLAGNFIPPTQPKIEGTVRNVLKEGLLLKDNLNVNAFRYGVIGSTDTHLGTPGLVDETADYPGHGGAAGGADGQAVRTGVTDTPEFNPGGLAVVWATQNSRAALFDAMRRREVYATSGPRHVVRFFGGWELPSDICDVPNSVELAFANGVPMGSTLPRAEEGQTSPQFLVSALKDAGTLNNPGNDLQRIQIIKGWTDSNGETHEEIYEVAGDPDNGASVDTGSCATSGTGFEQLCELWTDPLFDLDQNAFYYARVVENPSCRWSQQQCIAAEDPIDCDGPEPVPEEYAPCCDEDIPKTVQERSWTSPIWYHKRAPIPPGC